MICEKRWRNRTSGVGTAVHGMERGWMVEVWGAVIVPRSVHRCCMRESSTDTACMYGGNDIVVACMQGRSKVVVASIYWSKLQVDRFDFSGNA